jgi:hypothetical protein
MKATNTKAATLIAALKAVGVADGKRANNLQVAAAAMVEAYPTRESWDAMTKETAQGLRAAYASGRLSSSDFKVWSAPVKGLTDAVKAERLALHRDVNTAWNRIVGHAYPKAKTEGTEAGKAEDDKGEADKVAAASKADQWAKILSAMLDQAQKAEGLKGVDVVGFTTALRTARSFVTLTSVTE